MRIGLCLSILFVCLLALAPGAATAGATPAPSCAQGPITRGATIEGTPCGDAIVVPPWVETVRGGGGNDTIVAAPIASSTDCPAGCELGIGSQTFEGGPGDDIVFGQRGNDTLRGGDGNDRLYGGVGDDLLEGGPGNDFLYGGFGADSIDGQAGDDFVRGDGTIDRIRDTGGGTDTLSYSTGITPGFGGTVGYAGFPPSPGGERGVRLELGAGGLNGDNGAAGFGGGVDEVEGQSFERVVGSPFADYLVGTEAGETIYGGGGADVILGKGGNDELHGGADGDYLDGGAGTNTLDGEAGEDNCQSGSSKIGCEGIAQEVVPRDSSKVSLGTMAPGQLGTSQIYLTGGGTADHVTATYLGASVGFELSSGSFDQSAAAEAGCVISTATQATCVLTAPLDSIVLAGMGGADSLTATGFPRSTEVVVLGGEGADDLSGGEASEDVLVDGPETGGVAADELTALGGDDALLHNGGADRLFGGDGNDLFLSVSICDGELLSGGPGRDNASWARLSEGVDARLDEGRAGEAGPGDAVACAGGSVDSLQSVEDLEGSEFADVLYGNAAANHLLGHSGPDRYFTGAGDDSIFANSADSDPAIDCGDGEDLALIDHPHPPQYEDAAPVNCETVQEADPNSFRRVTELPPPPKPKPPAGDRTPPGTRITAHPPKLMKTRKGTRRVVFRFASSEPGSRFRCKLDARPYRPCVSPRAFTVALGRHTLRVVAIDAAGNADRSPALFGFRVRRR